MEAPPENLAPSPSAPAVQLATHQRERILAATIELVSRRGYRGTSIDHIVKRARVGYPAFYQLFEGKEQCFLAAFERIVAETRAHLAAVLSPQMPWPEQICAALKLLGELISADPGRARVALVEVQTAGPAAYLCYQEAIDAAAPKLREGRVFNPDAASLSDTLEEATIAAIAWIFHQRLVSGEAEKLTGLSAEAIQIALSPYFGEAEAHRIALAGTSAPARRATTSTS